MRPNTPFAGKAAGVLPNDAFGKSSGTPTTPTPPAPSVPGFTWASDDWAMFEKYADTKTGKVLHALTLTAMQGSSGCAPRPSTTDGSLYDYMIVNPNGVGPYILVPKKAGKYAIVITCTPQQMPDGSNSAVLYPLILTVTD
jgi:hypothetical protein